MFYLNQNTSPDSPIVGLPTTSSVVTGFAVKELGRIADTVQTTVTTQNLPTDAFNLVAGFVSDVQDPNITTIPPGLWDLNFWASSTAGYNHQTIVQVKAYVYNGATLGEPFATSDELFIYDPGVVAQYTANLVVGAGVTITSSDRIYIEIWAKGSSNNYTLTLKFGAGTPTHLHTTIPSVSGTGVVKVEDGIFKTPASLIVDADIATNAAISLSKISGLTPQGIGAFSTADVISITKGGTGAISTQAAISNLGIGMRMVEAQTTANIVGTMVGNVFTVTAPGVFATELTTLGATGVSAVFTRPSWYTGVVKNSMYMTRFGSAQNGFIQSFVGPTGGTGATEITVGTTNITMVRVNLRTSPASLSSNVFTGPQTLRVNNTGAQNCPLIFQSGVALMGTPVGNAVEWFGDQMYLTTAAGVRTTNTTHVAIPATSTSAGLVGQVAVDNTNNWLYVCTAANVWKRAALTTF
jgi:hypothetical protein